MDLVLKVAADAGNKLSAPDVIRAATSSLLSSGAGDFDPSKTLAWMAPLLFRLKGKPYSLRDYYLFEPLYAMRKRPVYTVIKSGRQISKSTNIAVDCILRGQIPYNHALVMCPLFTQVARLSTNYFRPFISDSRFINQIRGKDVGSMNVLQRTLASNTNIYFSFAALDTERVRGLSANRLYIDEVQDMDPEFIPVIEEVLSAAKEPENVYTGTPKSHSNILQILFSESSSGTWVIPCSCGYYNTCCADMDLDNMVQQKGLCCAKCNGLVNSRAGFYRHLRASKLGKVSGYHMPQVVFPLHCENAAKWELVWRKKTKWAKGVYYNECLGEAFDTGSVLLSISDLQKASGLDFDFTIDQAVTRAHGSGFEGVTVGADWGGGGAGSVTKRKGMLFVSGGTSSFTVFSVVGHRDGMSEVLWMERMPESMSPQEEVKRLIELYVMFGAYRLGHDFGGAGFLRQDMLLQSGFPVSCLMPFMYTGMTAKSICTYVPPTNNTTRAHFSLDKTRSVMMIITQIKSQSLRFSRWSEALEKYVLEFLSLVVDHTTRDRASDLMRIMKHPRQSDDAVHAINYACTAHWHSTGRYPQMAIQHGISVDNTVIMDSINPRDPDWGDD